MLHTPTHPTISTQTHPTNQTFKLRPFQIDAHPEPASRPFTFLLPFISADNPYKKCSKLVAVSLLLVLLVLSINVHQRPSTLSKSPVKPLIPSHLSPQQSLAWLVPDVLGVPGGVPGSTLDSHSHSHSHTASTHSQSPNLPPALPNLSANLGSPPPKHPPANHHHYHHHTDTNNHTLSSFTPLLLLSFLTSFTTKSLDSLGYSTSTPCSTLPSSRSRRSLSFFYNTPLPSPDFLRSPRSITTAAAWIDSSSTIHLNYRPKTKQSLALLAQSNQKKSQVDRNSQPARSVVIINKQNK